MPRVSVWSGAPFRAVLLAIGLFAAILILTAGGAYLYLRHALLSETRGQVVAELALLDEVHDQGGTAGLIVALDQIAPSFGLTHRAVGYFRDDGTRLAGNIATDPGPALWQRAGIDLRHEGLTVPPDDKLFYLGSLPVEGGHVVVGRSLDSLARLERQVLVGLLLMGAIAVMAAVPIGYALSHRSMVKLDAMAGALEDVSSGRMGSRIPEGRHDDQIDRVATLMNLHLARLERLMGETRNAGAAMAHDLRTPLARAWLGLDEAARIAEAGGEAGPHIAAAQDDLARLRGIIDTMLRIARIEAGTDAPALAPVDLAALARDMAETFAPMAEDAGQSLICRISPVTVQGDGGMIRQALANLLQNAITHAGPGATITLVCDDGGLEVCDTGPGVPEAERAHLTEAFRRGDAARRGSGSGLGLALVRAVADRHGAGLGFEDAGPGLRARLTFPA